MLAPHNCNVTANGIIYMDTGPKVCWCVSLIQHGDQLRKDIIPGHGVRSQVMSIGPEGRH